MKKLKHSKYKNTGILFEILVRKLTTETLTSDKSVTIDIIKKYFGNNSELSKELKLYNALLKEEFKSEAMALDYIRALKGAHSKLNKSTLRRQRYSLIKEIKDYFSMDKVAKTRITNYKNLASAYLIFSYDEVDNPKQIMEAKQSIVGSILKGNVPETPNPVLESFSKQDKDTRLLAYRMLVDKFNSKYDGLNEDQKHLLNKYITQVNDTETLKEYINTIIPGIKVKLAEHVKKIDDRVTQIKIQKLSELLCDVENINVIKEAHVLNILRYFDLIQELDEVHG